jgi:hypothetical protein
VRYQVRRGLRVVLLVPPIAFLFGGLRDRRLCGVGGGAGYGHVWGYLYPAAG